MLQRLSRALLGPRFPGAHRRGADQRLDQQPAEDLDADSPPMHVTRSNGDRKREEACRLGGLLMDYLIFLVIC